MPEWGLSSSRAAVAAAMADLVVVVAWMAERWIVLVSSLDRAGFPTVGAQRHAIGGDDVQHFRPDLAALRRARGLRTGPAKTAQGIERAGEAEPLQRHGLLARGLGHHGARQIRRDRRGHVASLDQLR